MKIAFGTYAMPQSPLEDAIPLLAEIGYDGIEICLSPRHIGSMPAEINSERRKRIRDMLREHGMGIPALFMTGQIFHEDDSEHQRNLEHTRRTIQLARDLGMADAPVLAMGIGGKTDQWDYVRGRVVSRFRDFAALGVQEGFVLAGEAHCGASVDRSDRALWLINAVDSPCARLHFDIVHFTSPVKTNPKRYAVSCRSPPIPTSQMPENTRTVPSIYCFWVMVIWMPLNMSRPCNKGDGTVT